MPLDLLQQLSYLILKSQLFVRLVTYSLIYHLSIQVLVIVMENGVQHQTAHVRNSSSHLECN